MPRLYFASVVLTSGKVWLLGGEYSGPALDSTWNPTGEMYDPVSNSWSPIAPYPNQTGCPQVTITSSGNLTAGSNIITAIPSTAGFQVGRPVTGTGIPAGTNILSVDSINQVHITQNSTFTIAGATLKFLRVLRAACFGDVPAILLPGNQVLAGNLTNRSVFAYDVATNTWIPKAGKFYDDSSDEETWVKLPDGRILTYDIFQSNRAGGGYAEVYDPLRNTWSGISPGDGSAGGTLSLLSSDALGSELGPILRLQDGRIFVIGANGRTALYNPASNTWADGPAVVGTLNGIPSLFGADDAPAAIMPNGHVLLAADAGPSSVTAPVSIVAGSNIVTAIPSTSRFQAGWSAAGAGIPAGTRILSVDSISQVHLTANATVTSATAIIQFGGTFSPRPSSSTMIRSRARFRAYHRPFRLPTWISRRRMS